MDATLTAGIVAIALTGCVHFVFGRMAWRILRGADTLEPGGSYGRQVFGRSRRRG